MPGLFAYSRVLNSQEVFVVLNTATTNQTLPARTLTYAAGTALVNLLNTNESITVLANSQTPPITVAGTTAKLFIAQSQWQTPDPLVISNVPAHDATNISTVAPVVIQFSRRMNTNSVQAAFSTTPSVTGNFSWSAAGDTLTFTPSLSGFTALTNISLTISNSAADFASNQPMHAPYTLLFHTGAAPSVVAFSSPASNGTVIPAGSNTTYLIQVCFTPALDTNDASMFTLTINGVLQSRASYVFRPPGSVSGCPGLRSLLYNWSGATVGTNVININFTNGATVLSDSRTVIVAPPLAISGLINHNQTVVWSSTPGVNYQVLATTNLLKPFTPISGVIQATNFSTSFIDASNSPPVPQKFYEIEAVQ